MRYTIKEGDSLSSIAKEFDVTVGWLLSANMIPDKNKIYVGDSIHVPGPIIRAVKRFFEFTGWE